MFLWNPWAMHPPPFRRGQRLSDWPSCHLDVRCCIGAKLYPLRLLATKHGERTFDEVLTRLRCERWPPISLRRKGKRVFTRFA